MSKTAISGVMWGTTKAKSVVNPHKVTDEQLAESSMAYPVIRKVIDDALSYTTEADADKQRAMDMLERARIRSARGRHNSEGFGE